MTDPYAVPPDAAAGDQTIPLVPEGGFAQPAQRPFDETLIDPLAGSDPWASGPGLGWTTPSTPAAPAPSAAPSPAPATAPSPAPAPTPEPLTSPPVASAGIVPPPATPQPTAYPAPVSYPGAAQARATAYPTAGDAIPPQPGASYAPQPAPVPPQPAPAYPPSSAQPWEGYPEPAGIPGQAYAASPYAGQQWPATIPDPVNHNYGYNYGFDATTDHPNAIPSLVLGIIGLVLFAPVAPIAWHLGAKGQREAKLDPGRWRDTGMIAAGKVLGIIGTMILALGAAFILFIFLAIVVFGA